MLPGRENFTRGNKQKISRRKFGVTRSLGKSRGGKIPGRQNLPAVPGPVPVTEKESGKRESKAGKKTAAGKSMEKVRSMAL